MPDRGSNRRARPRALQGRATYPAIPAAPASLASQIVVGIGARTCAKALFFGGRELVPRACESVAIEVRPASDLFRLQFDHAVVIVLSMDVVGSDTSCTLPMDPEKVSEALGPLKDRAVLCAGDGDLETHLAWAAAGFVRGRRPENLAAFLRAKLQLHDVLERWHLPAPEPESFMAAALEVLPSVFRLGVAGWARRLGYSSRWLADECDRWCGRPPLEIVLCYRVSLAVPLLERGDATERACAMAAGFSRIRDWRNARRRVGVPGITGTPRTLGDLGASENGRGVPILARSQSIETAVYSRE